MNDPNKPRSAGILPAVSGASRPRFEDLKIRDRGRLPHWESEGAVYFVTFRLADSLPQKVLNDILFEREDKVATARHLGRDLTPTEVQRLLALSSRRVEEYLDSGAGACHLADPAVAQIVADALRYFNSERYRLFAWCVMQNHVHVVFRILPGHTLPKIVHSWKSFTAKEANRVLARSGVFWQREYYDRLIRDEAEFGKAVQYV